MIWPFRENGKWHWKRVSLARLVPISIDRQYIAYYQLELRNGELVQQEFLVESSKYTMWQAHDGVRLLNQHGVMRL